MIIILIMIIMLAYTVYIYRYTCSIDVCVYMCIYVVICMCIHIYIYIYIYIYRERCIYTWIPGRLLVGVRIVRASGRPQERRSSLGPRKPDPTPTLWGRGLSVWPPDLEFSLIESRRRSKPLHLAHQMVPLFMSPVGPIQ